MQIQIQDVEGTAEAQTVMEGLRAYNLAKSGTGDKRPLILSVKNANGIVVGGMVAETRWTWLYVSLLWVDESQRGTGLGTRLMKAAEDEALKRGCKSAYLDTFSFQARPFYERLGYSVFGALDEFPVGHQRYFLRKKLKAD